MTLLEFVVRICCAVGFGFLIGLERQLTGHVAGIRTNILVSIGACMFTSFSVLMDATDRTRIAAQVVTGIGFLCSGIIFKEGFNVKGINTAATIWCTAAIGVLCSGEFLLYPAAATAILLASSMVFRFVSGMIQPLARFEDEEGENTYLLYVSCLNESEFYIRSEIMNNLSKTGLHLTNLKGAEVGGMVEIEATVQLRGKRRDESVEIIVARIALEKGVTKAGWRRI